MHKEGEARLSKASGDRLSQQMTPADFERCVYSVGFTV